MACPSEAELLGYLREPAGHAFVRDHVGNCEGCEQLLVAFAELSASHSPALARGSDSHAVIDVGSAETVDASDAPKPHDERIPVEGDVLGRYVLEGPLGRGAMGVVFAAHDPKLERRVALKLLLGRERSAIEEARVLLEARAAARVHDAHLVSVYDVGTWNGRVFLAMELIDGPTLTRWLAEKRELPAIIDVFADVARGLVAAHRAGLVHCDIKPDNILIGASGAKLSDFGLAMTADDTVGGMRGTPIYMAPEALRGEIPTAASDQYSLAASLYEAVTKQRIELRVDAKKDRTPRPIEAKQLAGTPRWLAKLLERGLAHDPAQRFASVADLLAALVRGDTRRRRMIGAASALAVVAATSFAYAATRTQAEDPCPAPRAELGRVWNPVAMSAVVTALGPDGATAAQRLDTYGAAWIDSSVAVCRDTRVSHRYSDSVLDLRTRCLDRARSRLGALADQLSTKTPADQAFGAIDNLPPLATCDNVAALSTTTPDVSLAVRAQQVTWDSVLAVAETMIDLRRPEAALVQVQAIDATGDKDIAAQAQYLAGLALGQLDRVKDAAEAYERAYEDARASANESLEVKIALEMASLLDREPATRADAKGWIGRGRAVAERLDSPTLLSLLAEREGSLAYSSNDYPAAVAAFTRTLELQAKTGTTGMPRALVRSSLALALNKTGKSDLARDMIKQAMAELTAARGDTHPALITMWNTLGSIELSVGNVTAARDALTEARRRAALSKGETDRIVIALDVNLASLALRAEDLVAAKAGYQRAIDALERTDRKGSASWRTARQGLAQLAEHADDYATAQAILEDLLAQRLADKQQEPAAVAGLRTDLASAMMAHHQEKEADEQMRLARATYVEVYGANSPKVARVDLQRVGFATAMKDYGNALKIVAPYLARTDLPPNVLAEVNWRAARATTDKPRAKKLATTALQLAKDTGDTGFVAEINTWLAQQG
ncbi:MAG TPA: protein kinase [Kofleriaceae bacterium]